MFRSYLSTIGQWLLQRIILIPKKDRPSTKWFILAFFIASNAVSVVYAIGNPTGANILSHATNIGKYVAMNSLLFIIWTFIISALLSFLYIPLPRLFLGSFSYIIFASVYMLIEENSGILFSFIIGISYSLFWTLLTFVFILLFHQKKRRVVTLAILSFVIVSIYLVLQNVQDQRLTSDIPAIADIDSKQLSVENPSEQGNYPYTFFTYGSGNDKQREEFGEGVNILTPTVDASHFITKWSEKREKFWGFDQNQLPVNGRAWLPDGEGPFPVILMVHGNHTMEYFSTGGYDYLGELLASRGFMAVSVDEDFINYSNVSGIPNDNYSLRAWMLLQHLVQLDTFNQTPGHPLFQKLDLQNVGLVGHSRGGQAVAMAADYERFFEGEPWLETMENIQIQGVVAIAPTDKSIDSKKPRLKNVSYLLIQGAQDADISNFRGDHQFYRTSVDSDSNTFKSSLYIPGANHSQFNTEWGSMDISLPKGLFLSQRNIMDREDQRQIAKVYISAFFERTLHKNMPYEKLFQDYQYGNHWLPDSLLINKYQNSSYDPLVEFEHKKTVRAGGITTEDFGFSKMEVITPKDRQNNSRPADALQLEWDDSATYTMNLSNWNHQKIESQENLVLTMANYQVDGPNPDIEIALETVDGVSVQLPLSQFMAFPPVVSSEFTPFGLFDDIFRDGKYEESWEPVFQTFEIPIHAFEQENSAFNKNKLSKVTLSFNPTPGKILLESIGLSCFGGACGQSPEFVE